MNSISNVFVPFTTYYGECLIHESAPEMFEIYPMDKIIEGLDSADCNYKDFYYYMFTKYNQPAFFFITRSKLNFDALEQVWGEKSEAYLVEGAIWDIDRERYLSIDLNNPFSSIRKNHTSREDFFYKFLIYDGGLPHVVQLNNGDSYAIIVEINEKDIDFVNSRIIPTCVTYVRNQDSSHICRQRVIFFQDEIDKNYYSSLEHDVRLIFGFDETEPASFSKYSESKKHFKCEREDRMITIEENTFYSYTCSKVLFSHCIFGAQAPAGAPTLLHEYENDEDYEFIKKDDHSNISIVDMMSYLISGDTILITRCPYGDFGDMVMVLFEPQSIEFDFNNSFYDYEVVEADDEKIRSHLILKVFFERKNSSFDILYFDVTARTLFDKKP